MKSNRTLNLPRKSWYLKLIDTSGRPRWDVSPLWANPEAFSALVHDTEEHFKDVEYDLIVALDALGFILGAALANSSGKGLVPLRKGGKLPLPEERLASVEFHDYDQTDKRFEIVKDLVKPGRRVLIVDEWMGTGAQIRAAVQLMEQLKAKIAGIAVLYVFPDEPANLEILKNHETFAANCLVCKHLECRCYASLDEVPSAESDADKDSDLQCHFRDRCRTKPNQERCITDLL